MRIPRSNIAFVFVWVALCAMIELWGVFEGWAAFGIYCLLAATFNISLRALIRYVIIEAAEKVRAARRAE